MNTFSINTLGCKTNQYESQQIRQLLEAQGLKQVCVQQKPDLVIVNTCCVTKAASAKSRQFVHKAQKLSPRAKIILCGCLPAVNIGELNNLGKNVQLIKYRQNLAATLEQIVANTSQIDKPIGSRTQNDSKIKDKESLNYSKLPLLTSFKGQTRAFLKVQDGCDGYCTYCIIPKTRPDLSSVPMKNALNEAQNLVIAGHKEIVITGIFLGAYGMDTVRKIKWPKKENENFIKLVENISNVPGLSRIRLSSLEPGDVTGKLLDIFCKRPNIMPHLHLSLQSGSESILKKMCRQYRPADFLKKIELINSKLDQAAITTDIIVGFPGETEEDFQQSLDLAEKAAFSKIHVFSFSPRKSTAAVKLSKIYGPVKPQIIKQRSSALRELNGRLESAFRDKFIGKFTNVLIEGTANGFALGRAERYFMAKIHNSDKKIRKNDIAKVKIVENEKNNVLAELVDIIG